MNNFTEKMKAFFEKMPICVLTVTAFVRTMVIGAVGVVASFLLLWVTGIYEKLETALDLKHNSPIVRVPLWAAIAAFVLCMFIGLLMYFHKYKRSDKKTAFGNAIESAFVKRAGKEE